MRYFLVSYLSPEGFGSIWFEHKTFPNYKWLCLKISEGRIDNNIIIVNIFEFKDKEDFDTFKFEE
ncbi:MAG: hypothetical protein ACFB0B_11790 [Thermonemataceae bacterium]